MYYRAVRLIPLCLVRGFLFPVLAVGAIVAAVAYIASKGQEAAK